MGSTPGWSGVSPSIFEKTRYQIGLEVHPQYGKGLTKIDRAYLLARRRASNTMTTNTNCVRYTVLGLGILISVGFPLAVTIVCGINVKKLADTGDTEGANFNIGLSVIFGLLTLRSLCGLLDSCYLYYQYPTVEGPHISLGTPLKDIVIVNHPQDTMRMVGTQPIL